MEVESLGSTKNLRVIKEGEGNLLEYSKKSLKND